MAGITEFWTKCYICTNGRMLMHYGNDRAFYGEPSICIEGDAQIHVFGGVDKMHHVEYIIAPCAVYRHEFFDRDINAVHITATI